MVPMSRRRLPSVFCLPAALAAIAASGCGSARARPPIQPGVASIAPTPPLSEIHVDSSCQILQLPASAVLGAQPSGPHSDPAICHLESVHTSDHVEEMIRQGARTRTLVTIAEQEYLLGNVTGAPVLFVVEQPLPTGWQIDSDPPPFQVFGSTALFHAMADPGQIVRLHVGQRRTVPVHDSDPQAPALPSRRAAP